MKDFPLILCEDFPDGCGNWKVPRSYCGVVGAVYDNDSRLCGDCCLKLIVRDDEIGRAPVSSDRVFFHKERNSNGNSSCFQESEEQRRGETNRRHSGRGVF